MTLPAFSRIVLDRFGGVDVLETRTDPEPPPPGGGQVRIAVEASCVQFTDTIIRRGKYPDAGKPPITLGYDVVGRIDAVGPSADAFNVGERVADMTVIGSNATHVVRPAAGLVRVPDALDAAEACAVILSGVTAWQMLFRQATLSKGDAVLIQGGSGGVGWFGVQFAVQAGMRVWTTARADQDDLRALGAMPLDYRDPNYPERLREATAGGVAWAFDGIGAHGFRDSLGSLRKGGRLVFIGTSDAVNAGHSMIGTGALLLARNLLPWSPRISLYSVTGMRKRHPEWFKEDLAKLFSLLAERKLRVRIDRRIGFDGVAEAHRDLEAGGVRGKIVLDPRD